MKKHLKRVTAPRPWPIPRKTAFWVAKPSPGPHGVAYAMPLLSVVRDLLHLADTAKEARLLIGRREAAVDGRARTDPKYPVGFMDVVSIPKLKQDYRMLLDAKGRFKLVKIGEAERGWKLVRIEGKTTVGGGKTQLHCHDGRNLLLPKDAYKTGDVLKIELPSQKILGSFPLDRGSTAMLVAGSHVGRLSTVEAYIVRRGSAPNIVTFREGHTTVKENVFVIGGATPEIALPEVSAL